MKKVTNITDLRNDMLAAYSAHRSGKIDNDALKTTANMAGKVIGSLKLEIEHQRLIKTHVPIPFLTSKEIVEELKTKIEK
jgi:hypothetical protein